MLSGSDSNCALESQGINLRSEIAESYRACGLRQFCIGLDTELRRLDQLALKADIKTLNAWEGA